MEKVKKIVIIGGESTGKSTLSKQLAIFFQTQWVPEFAREYLEKLSVPYTQNDLVEIAKGQIEKEKSLLPIANNYLFYDTNLFVIKVWSEHKYNSCAIEILNEISRNKYDAYILTSPDFPWTDDPLREHPKQKDRDYFFSVYYDIILSENTPFCIVNGNEKERLNHIFQFLDKLL